MSRIRQQEKARKSKEALLKAAQSLFAERKISDVGVREISAEAGVTTGTFYHYFTGKEDIIREIYSSHDENLGKVLQEWSEQPDGCCSHIQMFFSKNLAGNVLADGREFTCYRVFQMRSHSRDEHHLYIGMKKLIQKAVDVGELRADISVEEVNGYLFTVFRGVLYEWCLCEPEDIFSLEERLDRMIGYALRAFSA